MQSLLQYRRTGSFIRSRFSKPYSQKHGDEPGMERENGSLGDKRDEPSLPEDSMITPRLTDNEGGNNVLEVGWAGPKDPANPKNWPKAKRVTTTLLVAYICAACLMASSIDTAVLPQAAEDFDVSLVVESIPTAQFLIGSGIGSFVTGPFSETFGRNPVYLGSMIFFMIFTLAAGLSPNIGAQITFRFFVGFFGCAPLTVGGGTIADLWNSYEKVYGFPLFAIPAFGGGMLGPVIGSYVGTLDTWRWTEWISLLVAGLVSTIAAGFLPETHPGILLAWRAKHIRTVTGDERYRSRSEIVQTTLWRRMRIALTRPFLLATEPIIIVITLYLTLVWAILFTFLEGYTYVFTIPYGISQGLTNVLFVAMYVGVLFAGSLIPIILAWTKNEMKGQSSQIVRPETRLWYAMLGGAWAVPISLFWMGWTNYPSISIWSPILASSLFGFGLINIFMTSYMYVIDAYQVNAASALTFATVTRFLVSGGLVVAGIPFYENVGSHWTLTILGVFATLLAPTPYLLYHYGPRIRKASRYTAYED